MAVVRARTAPPYGLIAFVALWVIATVFAVLFYVKWSQSSTELSKLENDYREAASRNDLSLVPAIRGQDKSGSALRAAYNQLEAMKTMLVGAPNTPFNEVEAQFHQILKGAGLSEKESAKNAITTLASDRDNQAKLYADIKKQFDDINVQISQASSQNQNHMSTLQKDLETIRGQLNAANDNLAKAEAARNEAVAKGQANIDALNAKNEQDTREKVLQIDQDKALIAQLTDQVKQLQLRLRNNSGGNNSDVGEADGKILRVSPTNNEVYIDLTRVADRITPGMTFTVYDPRIGVRYGADNDHPNPGKGSIEVIEPGETSSLCRITNTTKGETIQQGDLIGNVVYNKNKARKSRFVIVGDFDLDGDGVATADERERLVRLVTSWGGIVEDKVTTQTDYLVSGARPANPAMPLGDEAATAPTPGSTADQRSKLQAQYDELTNEASRLGIPILNANRFFSMIGYYGTTVVRY